VQPLSRLRTFIFSCILPVGLWAQACQSDYGAQPHALESLVSNESTRVQFDENWISFVPVQSSTDVGLVFYPGGKVQAESYAPIIRGLADRGIPSYIVYVTADLAILDMNAPLAVFEEDNRAHWVLAGHSLGGVAAADLAARDERVVGLSLWASYPGSWVDLSEAEMAVQSLAGSEDQVLNRENWESSEEQLPDLTQWVDISGGNHSQFGDYGFQEGDGVATISPEEQWAVTVDAVESMISQLE
jgi:hypothetical protein